MKLEAGTYTLQGVPPVLYWAERLATCAASVARGAELVRSGDGAGVWDDREELADYMNDAVIMLCKLSAAISEQLFDAESKRQGSQ